MSKAKVAILAPTMSGFTEETTVSLIGMMMYSYSRGVQVDIINESVTGVAKCRNALVEEALEHDFTHVLFVDSDMFFPIDILERLLAHDKYIVGSTYVGRKLPAFMLGGPLYEDDRTMTSGLIEAETMPGGMMLIKTDVYDAIPRPWYFESSAYDGAPSEQFVNCIQDNLVSPLPDAIMKTILAIPELKTWLWTHQHDKHGLTCEVSEDANFVFKARRFGFSTWSDLDIAPTIGHVGKYVYGMKDMGNG